MKSQMLIRPEAVSRSFGQPSMATFVSNDQGSDDPEDDKYAQRDAMFAAAIGRVLHQHYRGHYWNVIVDSRPHAGIAKIWISILMSAGCPYILHLVDAHSPWHVIRAGGELLERFKIPRSTIDLPAVLAAQKRQGPLWDRMAPPGGHIQGR